MGTILILGRPEDLCCELVRQQLCCTGHDVWFLSEDQLLPDLRFVWAPPDANGVIEYRGRVERFGDIDGVLCRFYGIPIQPEDYATPNGQYVSAEWNALLMAWLHKLGCPVFNRLRPELWYKSRLNVPDLASLVPRSPFKRPRSLITTVHDDARAFCRSSPGPVHYSPLTQPARYRIQSEAHQEQLALLNHSLPLYLTECVEGRALDAFVTAHDVVFVDADGNIAEDVRSATRNACVDMGASLGLGFYRLSLVETADDEWFCLGLDRMPQLYNCAPDAQFQIARHLADSLSARLGA